MHEKCLLREDRNGVCYLTLNRPEKLNTLDSVLFSRQEYSSINRTLTEAILVSSTLADIGFKNARHSQFDCAP